MMIWFLSLLAGAVLGQAQEAAPAQPRPVLVELYTSQGCPLCPAANVYLSELDASEDVFALGFSVDYWDIYGWRDTFARPEFTARQRDYKSRFGLTRVYTPQMVIDGVREATAGNTEGVEAAMAAQRASRPDEVIYAVSRASGGGNYRVHITGARPPGGTADIWLAVYRPGWVAVPIGAGANAGSEMRIYNPVRTLIHLGEWTGEPVDYGLALPSGVNGAVFVQGGETGPVYALSVFPPDATDAAEPR